MWKPKHKNGMKKFIVLICCIALGFAAKAQKLEGSFEVLLEETRVNFELSFAKASIHGMSEAEFAKYETDWNKDMPQIIGCFVEDMNNEIMGIVRFGSYPTAKYKLKVEVIEVTTYGGFDSDVYLLDNNNNTLAKISGLVSAGGAWGTKLYLIKRGASDSGEALGELLYKTLTKKTKSK